MVAEASEIPSEAEQPRKRIKLASSVAPVSSLEFLTLESPHPYGVLPEGNRFLQEDDGETGQEETSSSLSLKDQLKDECWLHILGFCSAPDLGRLALTSRWFYAVCHQPELWRDLVLRRLDGTGVISTAGPTWKDTYVKMYHHDSKNGALCPHAPLPVPGVYSDYVYRLHLCRSFAIPSSWLGSDSGNIDRVPVGKMTLERFFEQYERPNQPVVVVGAASTWKAMEQWQDPAYREQHTVGRSFRATSGTAAHSANFTMEAYHSYCRSSHLEESPLYLFDRTALQPGSDLWKDYMPDLQRTCPYWDPQRCAETGHDLFQLLGEEQRPDHTWLIMGPRRSGSVFHIDPNGTHAWNATICGRKRWIFYPPGMAPPGVHPSPDGDHVALPLSVGEWIFQFWDEHVERLKSAPPSERPLECTAGPGDVLFVPHGWWHMVVNLDEMNVAITHNYVSPSNLGNVLRFLRTKRDQVSGCRDRPEAIKPEQLYEEFVKSLKSQHSKRLQNALDQADWTCKAWSSDSAPPSVPKSYTDGKPDTVLKKPSVMEKAKDGGTGFSFSFM